MSSRARSKFKADTKAKRDADAAKVQPTTAPVLPPSNAPFALASDGTLFINAVGVTPLKAAALRGRVFFIGAALCESEAKFARDRLENAGDELRARLADALATGEPLVWPSTQAPPATGTEAKATGTAPSQS